LNILVEGEILSEKKATYQTELMKLILKYKIALNKNIKSKVYSLKIVRYSERLDQSFDPKIY